MRALLRAVRFDGRTRNVRRFAKPFAQNSDEWVPIALEMERDVTS